MSQSISMRVSKFRFEGTQFTKFLRDEVINIHKYAMQNMLEYLVTFTPNFTGESQATFRKFRDYLSNQGLVVQLNDVTNVEKLSGYRKSLLNRWNVPAKIANLPNAGNVTAAGNESFFKVVINDRIGGAGGGSQSFSITVDYTSGSEAFTDNEHMRGIFVEAKKNYKEFFEGGLRQLFEPTNFTKKLKSFFHRVDIRST